LTNPVNYLANPVKVITPPLARAAEAGVGYFSGSGGSDLAEAARAGYKGGSAGQALLDAMRGKGSQSDALQVASTALGKMAEDRKSAYVAGMQSVKGDAAPIDITPIDAAYRKTAESLFEGDMPKVDENTLRSMEDIKGYIGEAGQNPTAIILDALKQRISNNAPNFTDTVGQQGRVYSEMQNAVKDAIVQQHPEYARVMKDYEGAKTTETEIKKALSLGINNSADQGIRKLQSVFRNNANSNYGSRVDNAKILADNGAETLMPMLAGQSLNSLLPRGLMKYVAGVGAYHAVPAAVSTLGASLLPLILASPRLMGELAYKAGQGTRMGVKGVQLSGINKDTLVNALVASQGSSLAGARQ
jgi:hypothetical protein